MNIPKKVKVGGVTYSVKLAEDWIGNRGYDGEFCMSEPRGNVIYIDSSLTQEGKEITLIHEALHAMNSTMSHEFLDSLSQQLYQFLKDNNLLK